MVSFIALKAPANLPSQTLYREERGELEYRVHSSAMMVFYYCLSLSFLGGAGLFAYGDYTCNESLLECNEELRISGLVIVIASLLSFPLYSTFYSFNR